MKSFVMVEQREWKWFSTRSRRYSGRSCIANLLENYLRHAKTNTNVVSRQLHTIRRRFPYGRLTPCKGFNASCSSAPRQFASVFANFTSQSENASCLEKIENGSLGPLVRKIRKNKGLEQTDSYQAINSNFWYLVLSANRDDF